MKELISEKIEDIILVYGVTSYDKLCDSLQQEIVALLLNNEKYIDSINFITENDFVDEIVYSTVAALTDRSKKISLADSMLSAALAWYHDKAKEIYQETYDRLTERGAAV